MLFLPSPPRCRSDSILSQRMPLKKCIRKSVMLYCIFGLTLFYVWQQKTGYSSDYNEGSMERHLAVPLDGANRASLPQQRKPLWWGGGTAHQEGFPKWFVGQRKVSMGEDNPFGQPGPSLLKTITLNWTRKPTGSQGSCQSTVVIYPLQLHFEITIVSVLPWEATPWRACFNSPTWIQPGHEWLRPDIWPLDTSQPYLQKAQVISSSQSFFTHSLFIC